MLKRVVAGLLVLVMLGSAVMPAMAVTEANDEILLKRAVVASLDEKGKLQLNVTWVNETINLGNLSCSNNSCCSCENDTCPAIYSVEFNEVYNVSEKGESLKLLNVTVYNESFSYSLYMLSYRAERNQYNLTVFTTIMPSLSKYNQDQELTFATVINVVPKDNEKAQNMADIITLEESMKLADHYRILAKTLNKLRKNDETNWIWNKVKIELNNLAKIVEKELTQYNNELGRGTAIIMDPTYTPVFCAPQPLGTVGLTCVNPVGSWELTVCTLGAIGTVAGCVISCADTFPVGCVTCLTILYAIDYCKNACEQWTVCLYLIPGCLGDPLSCISQ